jgi:Cu(I)/Ag(I) efflux system membrane protein CusA/SilA
VKIFGPDLEVIQRIGHDIEGALSSLQGTASIYAERSFGGRYLDIRPDPEALGRYGLTVADAQSTLSMALGGDQVTTTVQGRERYPVQVRYARDFRESPTAIGRLLVSGGEGMQIPLAQVAQIGFVPGAPMIRSENGQLNDLVSIDVRGRDIGGYVAEAQAIVAREVKLPPGYRLEWSGQYEALERVKARLQVVVPLTLGLIALLLYLTFGTVAETAIVMLSLPFALVGGVWAMWLLDFNLSIAVAVGFIALAGVAAETGVVMVLYLDQAWEAAVRRASGGLGGQAVGRLDGPTGGRSDGPTVGDLLAAIESGAVNRLRPKLMTVAAIMLGLLPALWSHGTGAEVMRRIASPMVGGMVTSTVLTLVVIPVIYFLWRRRSIQVSKPARTDVPNRNSITP